MRDLLFSLACVLVCACRFDPSGLAVVADSAVPGPDSTVQPDAMSGPDAAGPDAPGPDAPAAPFCDSTNPDLVACYRFDDSTGNDQSQYGNDLTVNNAMLVSDRGGNVLQTDGSSNVSAAEDSSLDVTALTIEMWVNPDALPGTGRVALLDNDGQYGLFLYADDIVRCTSGGQIDADYALPTGQWSHVACTNDGSQLAVWINGEMKNSTDTGTINTGGNDGLKVAMNGPSGDNFSGKLDDIRMWRVARSAGDLCAAAAPLCTQ